MYWMTNEDDDKNNKICQVYDWKQEKYLPVGAEK